MFPAVKSREVKRERRKFARFLSEFPTNRRNISSSDVSE